MLRKTLISQDPISSHEKTKFNFSQIQEDSNNFIHFL